MCAQKIIASLCVAGRLPPALFIGQIVFAKLFAPVTLQALEAPCHGEGHIYWQHRAQAGKVYKGVRSHESSTDKAKAAFPLFSDVMCHGCWSLLPSWL